MEIRLHKYLSACGVGSRRWCEEQIERGLIAVNDQIVTSHGVQIDPEKDAIRYKGKLVQPEQYVYYAVNKPTGVVCSCRVDKNYLRVIDLIPNPKPRLYNVGRLDVDSEGLIFLTNDGQFSNLVSHPRHELVKEYRVWLNALLTDEECKRIRRGIPVKDLYVARGRIKKVIKCDVGCEVRIELREGKNREIRKMFGRLDKKVLRLQRIRIGPICLGDLPRGTYRELSQDEINAIRHLAEE